MTNRNGVYIYRIDVLNYALTNIWNNALNQSYLFACHIHHNYELNYSGYDDV